MLGLTGRMKKVEKKLARKQKASRISFLMLKKKKT